MRTDEAGQPCPETLGEYRKYCVALGGEDSQAVVFLDSKIADSSNGEDEVVVAPDSQMRLVLCPMMIQPSGESM